MKTAALRVLGYFISTFAQSIENNSSEKNQNQTEENNRNVNDQSIISVNHLINDLTISIDQSMEINRNIEQFNDFNYWKKNQYLIFNIDDDHNEKSFLQSSIKCLTPYEKSKQYSINDIQVNFFFFLFKKKTFFSINFSFSKRIVPIELIDFYRSLIEQSYTSGIETDIVHQGAFTFPAVALTLGNQHWHLIKDIHKKFSEDLQVNFINFHY